MSRELDLLDLRILDGLAVYGVRNISKAARTLAISESTLRKRLKRLSSHFYLRFNINIYHTNLGLKKAVVFVDTVPGYANMIFECLKANDFWIYVSRCYGKFEGCFAIYTIPKNNCIQFEQFLNELKLSDMVRNVEILWSTCFHAVQSRLKWFDPNTSQWSFHWDKWVKESTKENTTLPYTLIDPRDFPILGDEIDLFILKELEKDGQKTLTEIAKMLGVSQQLVGYHYKRHLVQKRLFESFEVTFEQFDPALSDVFIFILRFDSDKKLAKFANSLMDKPFAWSLGKVLEENALIARLYLPRKEFRQFIEALSKLVRIGFLKTYDYVIQDLEKTTRQTISYEFFKDGKWIYDHKKHIKNLQSLIRGAKLKRENFIERYA